MNQVVRLRDVTNGGEDAVAQGIPYIATVAIQGSADILFHRWNNEAVAEKAKAAKNSKAKKTDNIESYVYRDAGGDLCLPGENLRQSIVAAAKFRQDPRSPRKSAADLFKAGVIAITPLASFGVTAWDYEDARRVMVQRNGVTRVRPAMRAGWKLEFDFMVQTPEYISPNDLRETIEQAGRLVGVGDFRPTYGRFGVVGFAVRN